MGRFFVNFESAVKEWSEYAASLNKVDPPADQFESLPEAQDNAVEIPAVVSAVVDVILDGVVP